MSINKFDNTKLRLARLFKGLTQQELGAEAFVSRQFIHQLEGDVKTPSDELLAVLAEVLDVKPSFFTSQIISEVKPEQCHFRKRKTTTATLVNRVLSYGSIFDLLIALLRDKLDLPEPSFSEFSDFIENEFDGSLESIERTAELCREKWGYSKDAPINNIVRLAENEGAVVTTFNSVSGKVDALSIHKKYPVILINCEDKSVCRTRFTIAHELGHLVLHEGLETGDKNTEGQADKFASALIFPRSAFLREFPPAVKNGRFDWRYLTKLKLRWKMSYRAIIYRASSFGLISAQQYRYANIHLNKTGQTKSEKFDEQVELEVPTLIHDSFETLEEHLSIGFHDIADALQIEPTMLSIISGIDIPKTRAAGNVTHIASKSFRSVS